MSNAVKTAASVLALASVLLGAAAVAAPAPVAGPVKLSFATQENGTAAYNYATALQSVMIKGLPKGSAIYLTARSPGAVGAPVLVNKKQFDIVLSNSVPAKWASEEGLPGQSPLKNIATLGGGLGHDFINIMATKKFVDTTGITSMEQLVEKKFPVKLVIKKDGTLGELTAEKVLEALGVSIADIKSWGGDILKTGGYGIKTALGDNFFDLSIDHMGAGQLNTAELCAEHDMVQFQLADETLARLVDMGYDYVTIEPNTWSGQTEAIKSAGSQQLVLVSSSMDDSVAYALTKAMCEGAAELGEAVESLKYFDPKTAGKKSVTGIALHPGAKAYYQEQGWAFE